MVPYTLRLVGLPVFAGMLVGSFVVMPVSRNLSRIQVIQRSHLQIMEFLNGLIAALASAFLFRICAVAPGLRVPLILCSWISIYCLISRAGRAKWLSWLAGVTVGWFALARAIVGS